MSSNNNLFCVLAAVFISVFVNVETTLLLNQPCKKSVFYLSADFLVEILILNTYQLYFTVLIVQRSGRINKLENVCVIRMETESVV